jgi:lysophospholipase L1-like esterase
VIVTVISLTLLLAGEFLLRTIYPDEVLPASSYDRTMYQFDPEILVALKPNMESSFKRSKENGGDVIQWSTNSLGFRGGELRPDPDVRVVVYGDSNIQASFSALQDTFPYRLEKELRALTGRDIEVINGGVVGMGPDQSLLRLERDVVELEPDVVVFHVFADNDFGDLIRNRLFDLDPSGNLVLTEHERTVDGHLIPANDKSFLSALLIVRAAGRLRNTIWPGDGEYGVGRINTGEKMLEYLLEESARQYAVYESSGPGQYSHFADLYDADVAVRPRSESATAKIRLMDAVLRKASETVRSAGAKFFVVIQPSQIDLTKNSMLSYEDLGKHPDYRPDNLSRAVENILARRRIDGISLFHAFSARSTEDLYFKGDDDHWNDAGQSLAARLTAERLAPLLAPPPL